MIKKISLQSPDFESFINFGKKIYPENSIRQIQNEDFNLPYFHCGIMVTDGNDIIGRLAIYDNPNLYFGEKKAICIGNYECIDDEKVAKTLFDAAFSEIQAIDSQYIIGPMNGSTWDTHRFSTHHDAPSFFQEPYHHLYYNQHFLQNGMEVVAQYFTSLDTDLVFDHPKVLAREAEFRAQGVTFRNVVLADFEKELERLYDFNAAAFQTNHLYTPIEKNTFLDKYIKAKTIINPDFVILAEDADKNLLGYFFCSQDFYNKQDKHLILKTIARHPDKKWTGMGHVIGNLIYQRAAAQGFTAVIHAFMYDDGYSTTISKNFSGKKIKNYALYGKPIW